MKAIIKGKNDINGNITTQTFKEDNKELFEKKLEAIKSRVGKTLLYKVINIEVIK